MVANTPVEDDRPVPQQPSVHAPTVGPSVPPPGALARAGGPDRSDNIIIEELGIQDCIRTAPVNSAIFTGVNGCLLGNASIICQKGGYNMSTFNGYKLFTCFVDTQNLILARRGIMLECSLVGEYVLTMYLSGGPGTTQASFIAEFMGPDLQSNQKTCYLKFYEEKHILKIYNWAANRANFANNFKKMKSYLVPILSRCRDFNQIDIEIDLRFSVKLFQIYETFFQPCGTGPYPLDQYAWNRSLGSDGVSIRYNVFKTSGDSASINFCNRLGGLAISSGCDKILKNITIAVAIQLSRNFGLTLCSSIFRCDYQSFKTCFKEALIDTEFNYAIQCSTIKQPCLCGDENRCLILFVRQKVNRYRHDEAVCQQPQCLAFAREQTDKLEKIVFEAQTRTRDRGGASFDRESV